MLYLNTRHALPSIGIESVKGTLDSRIVRPIAQTDIRMAQSNKGNTQPTISIDTYNSRHAYGFTNHTDFAREHGQQGIADVQQATSEHTQKAWGNIENAAKQGRQVQVEYAKNKMMEFVNQKRYIVAQHIPDAEITVDVGEVVGEPDLGEYKTSIDTTAFADVNYNRGNIDIYIKDKGFIRHWTSEGGYDIYA